MNTRLGSNIRKMQIEEMNLMHITPTSGTDAASKGCGENNAGSDQDQTENNVFYAGQAFEQILPFCVVKIWPKDVDATCMIQEVVSLFEKKEQHHLQISEKIREKVVCEKTDIVYAFLLCFELEISIEGGQL